MKTFINYIVSGLKYKSISIITTFHFGIFKAIELDIYGRELFGK